MALMGTTRAAMTRNRRKSWSVCCAGARRSRTTTTCSFAATRGVCRRRTHLRERRQLRYPARHADEIRLPERGEGMEVPCLPVLGRSDIRGGPVRGARVTRRGCVSKAFLFPASAASHRSAATPHPGVSQRRDRRGRGGAGLSTCTS